MIFDKLENILLYNVVPDDIKDFVQNLSPDVKLGRVEFADGNYANIEKYETKFIENAKFESHKKYIDIQILVAGFENIYVTPVGNLLTDIEYDSKKDITFYSDKVSDNFFVSLDGSNFVVLYPHEAHAPQVCIAKNRGEVLKVVIKIKMQ